ncbi:MAG TPA: GGDEF domain-containing protein [Polyangia bacterium]|nr:GGDEF domain-containing protein [Polyangia bacterium]
MSERDDRRGFTDETNATPLLRITGDVQGPKRPCLVVIAGAHLGEIFPVEGEIIIGRDLDANLRLAEDEGVSRRHARVTPVADGALLADLGSQNGTFVDGDRVQERVLKEGMKIRIGQTTVLKFARYDAVEEAAQRQLLESALRDGLTRAFNRRYFIDRLAAEVRFAERHAQPLALIILDIDHFKTLNDAHGHLIGDDVLRAVVGVLADTLRAEDVLARYGGEEFAVLVRGVKRDNALVLGERLRKEVAEMGLTKEGGEKLAVTVSVGISMFPLENPADVPSEQMGKRLIELADAALYRAKNGGRNRVEG